MIDHNSIIKEIITSYSDVSNSSIDKIIDCVEITHHAKGETFIKSARTDEFEYFQLSGITRSFVIDENGDSVSISFFLDQTVITPNVARTFNHKSTINFEALQETILGKFRNMELVNLMREVPEIRSFANAVLQKELIQKSNKEIQNASLTAKHRLIQFRTDYPALENKVPHSMIASYLGITNISLSRLRKELLK